MDLVPLATTFGGIASDSQTLLTGAGILLVVLYLLFSQFGKRLSAMLHDVMFTNWRLGLLGLTGVVLSIASGWTRTLPDPIGGFTAMVRTRSGLASSSSSAIQRVETA